MAIRDEIITALVEGLAALQRRVNDVEAIRSIPGPQGERGEAGPPPSEDEIRQAAIRWLESNITQPADGKDGVDGKDGEQGPQGERGPAPTSEEIALAVEAWIEINRDSLRGPAGRDGDAGPAGMSGDAGPAGPRGPAGPAGPAGSSGVGIALVEQRDERSFWITLTDGKEFEIVLPKPKTAFGGGGGGSGSGVQSIGSADGSVIVSGTTNIDLSVPVAGSTNNVVLLVRNNTGATLTKGTAVYINGAIGQNPTVTKALATSDATSAQTLGLMSADLANNSTGYVTLIGSINDLDTAAYTDGQQLYLSPTVAGGLTATKPHAPNHMVYVAVVEHAHPVHGKLFVKVQNGYELDELHDVLISGVLNKDILQYDGSTGLWRNTPGVLDGGIFN